jgi:hypothetical protein
MPIPLDPLVAEMVERLNPNYREWFEERAGILEFDAGYPPEQAEPLALLMLLHRYPDALLDVVALQVEVDGVNRWVLTSEPTLTEEQLVTKGVKAVGTVRLADVLRQHFDGAAWLAVR